MKAVFYIKINQKMTKVREEEAPADILDPHLQVLGWVMLSFGMQPPIARLVKFQKIQTILEDYMMFVFDADSYVPPQSIGGL